MAASVLSVVPDRFSLVPKVSEEYAVQLTNHDDTRRVVFKLFTTGHSDFTVKPKQGILRPRQKEDVAIALRAGATNHGTTSNFMVRFRALAADEVYAVGGSNIKDLLESGSGGVPETTFFYCTVHLAPASMGSASQGEVYSMPPLAGRPAAPGTVPAAAVAADHEASPPERQQLSREGSSEAPQTRRAPVRESPVAVAAPGPSAQAIPADAELAALAREISDAQLQVQDAESTLEQISLQSNTVAARSKRDGSELAALQGNAAVSEGKQQQQHGGGAGRGGGCPLLVAIVGVAVAFVAGIAF